MSESTLERTTPVEVPAAQHPEPAESRLGDLVPVDPWYVVRLSLFGAYVVGYVWFFVANGLIIDRISVAISVATFLVIGHLGRPLRRWAWLGLDLLCYCAMWLCYEESRGWADRAGFPLQVEAPRNIDRFLFFGTDPNVWMQRHFYDARTIHWYDKVASATYFTHFIVPVIALAVVWVTSHHEFVRFLKRFASLLLVACTMFVLLPTVPPWMAADRKRYHYRIIDPLVRHTSRGFTELGMKGFVKGWQSALDWGNAVAAMPSLHSAFALFVPAFFLPRIRRRWLKALALCFPLVMLASLVYFGEHWVIDGLVGFALVGLSFLAWGWIERDQLRRRADRARRGLGLIAGADTRRHGGPAPAVMVDRQLLDAVVDGDDPMHAPALALYGHLVDDVQHGRIRLVALSTDLAAMPPGARRRAFAPITTTWVARQHLIAARRTRAPAAVALTAVMLKRERVRRMATVGSAFDRYDVDVRGV